MEFNICKLKLLISRHDILILFSYFISQVGSYVNNMPEWVNEWEAIAIKHMQ